MKQDIVKILNQIDDPVRTADIKAEDIRLVMFTSRNAAVNFVFLKNEKQPRYVVKFVGKNDIKPLFKNGYEVLSKIHASDNYNLKKTTPVPLSIGENGRYCYTVETAVNAMPFSQYLRINQGNKNEIARVFDMARCWLIDLHRGFGVAWISGSDLEANTEIINLLALIEKKDILNKSKMDKIKEIFSELEKISNNVLPLGGRHGDFSPWNMKFDAKKKKLFVYDWEYVNLLGFALIDLLNFSVISYPLIGASNKTAAEMKSGLFASNMDRALPDFSAFEKTFYESSWFADIVKNNILNYCNELKVKPEFFNALFLMFILMHLYRDEKILEMFLAKGLPSWLR